MVSTVVEDMDTAEEEEERKITPVKRVRQNMSRDYWVDCAGQDPQGLWWCLHMFYDWLQLCWLSSLILCTTENREVVEIIAYKWCFSIIHDDVIRYVLQRIWSTIYMHTSTLQAHCNCSLPVEYSLFHYR
jgi:hypothetical protein